MSKSTKIELWIEVGVRQGHVELFVDNVFFGFWPDMGGTEPVSVPNTATGRSPLHGGFKGIVRKVGKQEFLNYYYFLPFQEQELGTVRPSFCVYPIPTTTRTKSELKKWLEDKVEHPPEYDIASRREARNCVSFALDALSVCGIMTLQYRLPGLIPRPKKLAEVLDGDGGKVLGLKRQDVTIEPAKFRRKKS